MPGLHTKHELGQNSLACELQRSKDSIMAPSSWPDREWNDLGVTNTIQHDQCLPLGTSLQPAKALLYYQLRITVLTAINTHFATRIYFVAQCSIAEAVARRSRSIVGMRSPKS